MVRKADLKGICQCQTSNLSMRFIAEYQWHVKIKSNIQSSNMYFSSSYVQVSVKFIYKRQIAHEHCAPVLKVNTLNRLKSDHLKVTST